MLGGDSGARWEMQESMALWIGGLYEAYASSHFLVKQHS